jgi:CRP-like cAMP-binding protein
VVHEGDAPDGLYLLLSGALAVWKAVAADPRSPRSAARQEGGAGPARGDMVERRRLFGGDLFGEIGLLVNKVFVNKWIVYPLFYPRATF